MSSSPSSFPRVGETFQERYLLEQVIGQGGYARVYRAKQTDLGRNVAIKVLRTQHSNADKAEEAARRFEREAKVISLLRDPHTITVYDYGRTETGGLYMVAEFVDGTNLLDFVNAEGALDPARAAKMILGVLYSLQEAHGHGMLHRDIKPANIMVFELPGRPDQVKLLDFGIAKAFEEENTADSMNAALTARGRVVGSPGYMSPEQIRGEPLTPASDIYSVGLVFYEMLAARRAIDTDDLRAAFEQISQTPIRLPEKLFVPDELREIVEKMVEKGVEDRFQSVEEVIEALAAFVGTSPSQKPAPSPDEPSAPTAQPEPAAPSAPAAPLEVAPTEAAPQASSADRDEARRYRALAIVAVIVAAIAAGAFLTTSL